MTALASTGRTKRPGGELAFLDQLRRRFRTPRSPAVLLGIGDDCALLRPQPGRAIAVTTDLLLEGRHFRRDTHTAHSAGHRCLARGLSDLAAMGATPLACFLSLALPPGTLRTAPTRRWLDGFLNGLHDLARAARVPIAGGDTSESPANFLLADITLLGEVDPAHALTRAGAHLGDDLWVSGSLGGAAAELETMLARAARRPNTRPRDSARDPILHPQSFPQPRLTLGRALARRHPAITACIDLSDGLSTDLAHLCTESNVAARVDATRLPLHPLTRPLDPAHALHLALNGGEDYELLFTAAPATRFPRTLGGVPLTRIGRILPHRPRQPRVAITDQHGTTRPLVRAGFEHLTT